MKGEELGVHATEEAAAEAVNNYASINPAEHRGITSRFKGVNWSKRHGKWVAQCKKRGLGYHTTEEAAAQAVHNYATDGVVPVRVRTSTSQFKGVSWDKICKKWKAQHKGKKLGNHATEEAAAQAHDGWVENGIDPVVLRRDGLTPRKARRTSGLKAGAYTRSLLSST